MNREDREKVKRQKQNARKDEREKVIAEVLEIIDKMDKENEECDGDPSGLLRLLLRIEHRDFRERVLALKRRQINVGN